MRKFNLARLYKLLKVIAILILIFLFLRILYDWNKTDYFLSKEARTDCVGNSIEIQHKIDCGNVTFELYLQYNKDLEQSIHLIIIIPALFFGGIWLYKYLLPVKNQ